MDFAIVKCCSADAYDAVPQSLVKVDIGKALASLAAAGWHEVADAGVMCVVARDGVEATLYSSGRVMVKTADAGVAERTAKRLYADVGL